MGDLTFLHYQNPVALIPRFFNFIADHQYRNAMSRQIADNAVYSCFVGDINTDSRAIEKFQDIQKKVGNDWYAIMEEFASYRTGFQEVKYLKDENKKD